MGTTKKTKKPNPGSDEAIKVGCKCPVLDNGHGNGCGRNDTDGTPLFWISVACSIHGVESPNTTDTKGKNK